MPRFNPVTSPNKLPIAGFEFHGLDFAVRKGMGTDPVADCPFCGKQHHFSVRADTGQYQCLKCGEKGNLYTFIAKLHAGFFAETKAAHWKAISKRRLDTDAAWKTFQSAGLAYDDSKQVWYIPEFSTDKAMVNLRVWDGKKAPMGTSTCAAHLFLAESLPESDPKRPIFLCEGHWDALALRHLTSELDYSCTVIATPGAAVFKAGWESHFKGRDAFLCYDNDNAGQNGQKKVARLIKGEVNSLSLLKWPATAADGYDVNDFIREQLAAKKSPRSILSSFLALFQNEVKPRKGKIPTAEASTKPTKVPTFQQIVKEFRKSVHIDDNMADALAVMFAVVFSINIPGDPLWVFMVGPPGAGKTLLLRSMESSDRCYYLSSLTPHALVSGMRMEDGSDPSLIPEIMGKALILKDFTEVMGMPTSTQDELFGYLRGAYDGVIHKAFGHVTRHYDNCYFALVAGVTHAVHSHSRTSLGERFLKFEFIRENHDIESHIRAALQGFNHSLEVETQLRDMVCAFLNKPFPETKVKVPTWVHDRLIGLAQVIAFLRANVERGWKGDVSLRPRPEIGTRIAKQLQKLGQSLAVVFGKSSIDKTIYRLMERVAFDTAYGWHLDIISLLMKSHPAPMRKPDLQDQAQIGETSLGRKLEDLIELKAIVRAGQSKSGKVGKPAILYTVAPELAKLWKSAKIGDY